MSEIKIDIQSDEFKQEFESTQGFAKKVCEQFGFVFNPDERINTSVMQGLTRNKLIYSKRYCPCFVVIGDNESERKASFNRLCPCKPALEVEIPKEGKCSCGLFCTPTYAKKHAYLHEVDRAAHTHSRLLTAKECEMLLHKEDIDANELEALLEARKEGVTAFHLVDVRELMEYEQGHIKGCDYLVPTTSFYSALEQLEDKKATPVILYCHIGSRSKYCQKVLRDLGFKCVGNLDHGIVSCKKLVEY
jgi:ferredoxin-thioredoxin reductase catalytic subunit/rhodanese-related sulfurtransferase